MLVLNFPSLRILWARSAHAAVDLFRMLKRDAPEPDRDTAVGISWEEDDVEAAARGGAGGAPSFASAMHRAGNNLVALDILRKLPGVTQANSRAILAKVPSLAALASMGVAEIAPLVGPANAALLYAHLHKKWVDPKA
jgi:DNA excision repair protein ERCC-4